MKTQKNKKIWVDADKKKHFNETVNKRVAIIDRQINLIGKCAKGRTYAYTPEQVQKLTDYLADQIVKMNQRLNRKIEPKTNFNIGE